MSAAVTSVVCTHAEPVPSVVRHVLSLSRHVPVVLVCDHRPASDVDALRAGLAGAPGCGVTVVNNEGARGKKASQRAGLSLVATPWVLLTDADCHVEASFALPLERADLTQLPVRMEPARPGLLPRLWALEWTALQGVTSWSIAVRHPALCSGAGLLVRRELLAARNEGEQYASGDDMFLLSAAVRLGRSVAYCGDRRSCVATVTPSDWRGYLRQRGRWLRKSTGYGRSLRSTRAVAWLTLLSNALWVALLCVDAGWGAAAFAVKLALDVLTVQRARRATGARESLWLCPLLEVCYPLLLVAIGLRALAMGRREW